MCKLCLNRQIKGASEFTKNVNKAFAEKFGIDLNDAFNSELEIARRGLLKSYKDLHIKDDNGNTVFNLNPYGFLKEKAVADTVHPSLWLHGKAELEAGVFEVLPDKSYHSQPFTCRPFWWTQGRS